MINNEIKQIIPLFLVKIQDKVYGKTRMQKLVFLIERKIDKKKCEVNYHYSKYLHGPFSTELCNIIDDLIDEKFLTVTVEITSSGNMVYLYNITEEGEKHLQEHNREEIFEYLKNHISNISSNYRNLDLKELVRVSYHYL